MATIWNHLELDVHMQCSWFFANGSGVLWAARHSGTACDLTRLDISVLCALRGCPAVTIWNHLELDVRM